MNRCTIVFKSICTRSAPVAPRTRSSAFHSSSVVKISQSKKDATETLQDVFANRPKFNPDFDKIVQRYFPGAVDNQNLVSKVVDVLSKKGYKPENTLLATSLCCDELARQLESDFAGVYGPNFSLGGLSGFPFAGNTGFGAMAAHIPDDGFCLCVYGPHVGVSADGTVGKVERSGIELIDSCCGSAIAASNYVKNITDGGAVINIKIQEFTDFQQGAVQELILPHGKRLADAENRMVELPFALYESQDMLMSEILRKGATKVKSGIAVLGGIQVNTGPDTRDYFVPLKFNFVNNEGEVVDDLLSSIKLS